VWDGKISSLSILLTQSACLQFIATTCEPFLACIIWSALLSDPVPICMAMREEIFDWFGNFFAPPEINQSAWLGWKGEWNLVIELCVWFLKLGHHVFPYARELLPWIASVSHTKILEFFKAFCRDSNTKGFDTLLLEKELCRTSSLALADSGTSGRCQEGT